MVRQREAQAVAAATGFGALAAGLRAETRDAGVLVVSAIVLAGSLPAVPRRKGALRRPSAVRPPGWPLVRRRFQDQW